MILQFAINNLIYSRSNFLIIIFLNFFFIWLNWLNFNVITTDGMTCNEPLKKRINFLFKEFKYIIFDIL